MNVNLYLSDDLGQRTKEAELPLSRLLQAAVTEELERRSTMATTLSKPRVFKLLLEDDNGDRFVGRITGQCIASDYDHSECEVYLTDDERVILYDGGKLRYSQVDDPEEELLLILPDEAYADALRALGITPVTDI